MLMLAAPVLAQLGPFSFFQCCYPRPILSQLKRVRTSTDSSNNVRTTAKRQEIGSASQIMQSRQQAASPHQPIHANIRNHLKNLPSRHGSGLKKGTQRYYRVFGGPVLGQAQN
jgi:hypothetical protein